MAVSLQSFVSLVSQGALTPANAASATGNVDLLPVWEAIAAGEITVEQAEQELAELAPPPPGDDKPLTIEGSVFLPNPSKNNPNPKPIAMVQIGGGRAAPKSRSYARAEFDHRPEHQEAIRKWFADNSPEDIIARWRTDNGEGKSKGKRK